ncbi:hypothetical protein M2150_001802 [Lachnospiraceae bacterium PM6-15]|uniref:hypothetical protein n=1 Tax=Ohessyouella blattaphilus TaxID=2949333 RepID=UPI003E2F1DD5
MENFDDIINSAGSSLGSDRPFDKDAWAERKQEERKELYALVDTAATGVQSSGEKFKLYLDVQSKFDRYSVTNALLITEQMPQATQLKEFEAWKDTGVSIKKNQKGVRILEPGDEYMRDDGSVGTSYNVKKVFDVSQTTGRKRLQPQMKRDERLLLKALVNNPPVPIQSVEELQGNVGAYYDPQQQVISVRKGMDASDIFRSVAKELARVELSMGSEPYSRDATSFKAYCASYLLCQKNGIDVSGYDFSNIPDSMKEVETKDMRQELADIRDAASNISGRMAKVLEQAKAEREPEQER